MSLVAIIFTAVALAMDAFAVSITSGVTIKRLKIRNALRIGLFFGFFQAFMPLIGWLTGLSLRDFITGIDHWVVFGILTFIGLKMIYESFAIEIRDKNSEPLSIYLLLVLSVATSIDALAVGISFAFLKIFIITPIIAIGLITFFLSFAGVLIGSKFGHLFENRVKIVGGLILIGIGIKLLVEHLV